MSAEHM